MRAHVRLLVRYFEHWASISTISSFQTMRACFLISTDHHLQSAKHWELAPIHTPLSSFLGLPSTPYCSFLSLLGGTLSHLHVVPFNLDSLSRLLF